eukprot:306559-Prorocentrum_minimum.AAC.3
MIKYEHAFWFPFGVAAALVRSDPRPPYADTYWARGFRAFGEGRAARYQWLASPYEGVNAGSCCDTDKTYILGYVERHDGTGGRVGPSSRRAREGHENAPHLLPDAAVLSAGDAGICSQAKCTHICVKMTIAPERST